MEKGFEYNDETFDEVNGGYPVAVYDTKAEAEEAVVLLSGEKIASDPDVFSYGSEGAFGVLTGAKLDKVQAAIDAIPAGGTTYTYDPIAKKNIVSPRSYNPVENYWDINFGRRPTMEEALRLFQYFVVDLYEVSQVNMEQASVQH